MTTWMEAELGDAAGESEGVGTVASDPVANDD